MTMYIFVSVLDDYVQHCVGFVNEYVPDFDGSIRLCALFRQFWMTMCIIELVLFDSVHNCVGFETMCIIASVLDDYVHNCVGFVCLCA